MIKGKTPEEIRKTFNIKNDFTPAEEEQVCAYCCWRLCRIQTRWFLTAIVPLNFFLYLWLCSKFIHCGFASCSLVWPDTLPNAEHPTSDTTTSLFGDG